MPRLLLLLSQFPYDPASGAARNLRTVCQLVARQGFEVRCLATTASEAAASFDARDHLRRLGIQISDETFHRNGVESRLLRFEDRQIKYVLLDAGDRSPDAWPPSIESAFNDLLRHELSEFRPDILYTFGGSEAERIRFAMARKRGTKVVFGLQNAGYLHPAAFVDCDAVLSCSRFLSGLYHREIGLVSQSLPTPIEPEEIVASRREPIFFTFVNPTPAKGLMFMLTLADQIGRRRPDIPLLIVEGRATAGLMVRVAEECGMDLRNHENIMFSPAVPQPRQIFQATRVLLAPSVWQEPAGRVAAEALVNGVPPVVSDRGGLAEVCAGGGFVLSLPQTLTEVTRQPVSEHDIEPWLELICRLADDESFYNRACDAASEAGRQYAPHVLGPRYAAYFMSVLLGRSMNTPMGAG